LKFVRGRENVTERARNVAGAGFAPAGRKPERGNVACGRKLSLALRTMAKLAAARFEPEIVLRCDERIGGALDRNPFVHNRPPLVVRGAVGPKCALETILELLTMAAGAKRCNCGR